MATSEPENYKSLYKKFWKPLIENKLGLLDRDKVMRELSDYYFVLNEVPIIYDSITGGKLSKPSYFASTVLSVANDHMNKLFVRLILEEMLDLINDPIDREAVIDYAREIDAEEVEGWETAHSAS